MDVFIGFLIGLAYPPMLVIVIAAMISARSGSSVIVGVTSLIMLSGPVVWIMTFIALGLAAGFAAFAGWILGLGIATIMVLLFIVSRARQAGSSPPWTAHT